MTRALAVLAIVGLAAPALADDVLAEARELEAGLEYERALALVEAALAGGGADVDRLVELHVEAGKLDAGLDRALAAEDHFARALALRPELALPEGTSPKIAAPFYAARSTTRPLRAATTRSGAHLAVNVAPDPLHLVASVVVELVDPAGLHRELAATGGPVFAVDLPVGASAIEVVGLDDHGNRVLVAALPRAAPPPPPPPPPPPRTSIYARWSTYAIASGVALAAAGVCAWRTSVAQDEWNQLRGDTTEHDYSELRAVENRGRAWALAANIGFGVAAATAIASAIALVAHRREPALAITAGPGTLGVAGRF